MSPFPEDAAQEIEQVHSRWTELEAAGEAHSLMALCADDIELWPPDAQPLLGREAVSAWMVGPWFETADGGLTRYVYEPHSSKNHHTFV